MPFNNFFFKYPTLVFFLFFFKFRHELFGDFKETDILYLININENLFPNMVYQRPLQVIETMIYSYFPKLALEILA